MTKSRSGAAQAKKPAAMRRGIDRGGASLGAVARASNAPESACVSVSTARSLLAAEPRHGVLQGREIAHVDAVVAAQQIDELVRLLCLARAVHQGDALAQREADARQVGDELVLARGREGKALVEL